MPRSVPIANVHQARLSNYTHHFECRTLAKMFDKESTDLYLTLCQYVVPAGINLFGATDRKKEDWDMLIELANRYKVDCWFINPYYLSDIGWDAFQEDWKNLPELVHIPCVQVAPLVPLIHTRERIQYARR